MNNLKYLYHVSTNQSFGIVASGGFRILKLRGWTMGLTLPLLSLLPSPSIPFPSSYPHRSRPLKPSTRSGSTVRGTSYPRVVWGGAPAEIVFGALIFSFKILYLVAAILIIFLRTNLSKSVHPPLHTPYISSPNHCLLFAAQDKKQICTRGPYGPLYISLLTFLDEQI